MTETPWTYLMRTCVTLETYYAIEEVSKRIRHVTVELEWHSEIKILWENLKVFDWERIPNKQEFLERLCLTVWIYTSKKSLEEKVKLINIILVLL